MLKMSAYDSPFENFFSALFEISLYIKEETDRAIFIAHTFYFYSLEKISEEQRENVLRVLSPILDQLKRNSLHFQAYGLFKLPFVNEIGVSEEDCISLTNFLHSFPQPWNHFNKFLAIEPFKIREESLIYIPKSGFFFSRAFIKLLK